MSEWYPRPNDDAWVILTDLVFTTFEFPFITITGLSPKDSSRLRYYVYVIKGDGPGTIEIRFNQDVSQNYVTQDITANNTTVNSARLTAQTAGLITTDDGQDNGTPALYIIDIYRPDVGTPLQCNVRSAYIDSSAATIMLERVSITWNNTTDPLSSVTLVFNGGSGSAFGTRISIERRNSAQL